MDRAGWAIYVGTFTKMLFNALRLGFLVLPPPLVEPFAVARTLTDRHPPTLDQAILAEFILDGHFGHRLRQMRQIYAERMEVLCDAANQRLGGMLQVQKAASGMRTIDRNGQREFPQHLSAGTPRKNTATEELHLLL